MGTSAKFSCEAFESQDKARADTCSKYTMEGNATASPEFQVVEDLNIPVVLRCTILLFLKQYYAFSRLRIKFTRAKCEC